MLKQSFSEYLEIYFFSSLKKHFELCYFSVFPYLFMIISFHIKGEKGRPERRSLYKCCWNLEALEFFFNKL